MDSSESSTVCETCMQHTEHRIRVENFEMNGYFWNYCETCIGEQFKVGALIGLDVLLAHMIALRIVVLNIPISF